MTAPTVNIPRGGQRAAERQAQEKANRSSGSSYNTWEYLRLAGPERGDVYGESITVRVVTDEPDWRETRMHNFVKTKNAPADYPNDRKWPARMGSVCRHSEGFDAIYDECFICDDPSYKEKDEKTGKLKKPYAGLRLWAVAVVREPVKGTQEMADAGLIDEDQVGKMGATYQDVLVDRDVWKDGQVVGTEKVRKFVVLNQPMSFFDNLLGFANAYDGTVVDRDYKITRKGSGTDTTYTFAALNAVYEQVDGKRRKVDPRVEPFSSRYALPFDLDQVIADLASDQHYEWFFDTRVDSSYTERFGKSDKTEESTSTASKEENDVAQEGNNRDTIEKMRARMKENQRTKTG